MPEVMVPLTLTDVVSLPFMRRKCPQLHSHCRLAKWERAERIAWCCKSWSGVRNE